VAEGRDLPVYRRIADELRAAILDGSYQPGDQLPGENQLMETYKVARATARQGLSVLINEGLAVPRAGAGVFVREFRPVIRDGIARLGSSTWAAGRDIWSADAANRDLQVDQIEVGRALAPDHVRALLGLDDSAAEVVRRSRRFVLDGKPVLTSVSWLPAAIAGGTAIEQPETGPGGTYTRLAEAGHAPDRFREDLRARMPLAEETERLQLPPGTPVVEITRTAYTASGTPVEVNEMTADAGSYVFRYEFATADY
jgi:GntR family transcriptional regulator